MIETLDYGSQFFVLLLCGVRVWVRALRSRDRGWVLLCFFYACYALGDLYWLLCMALEGATPKLYSISELSWDAGYLFLCLLLRLVQSRREPVRARGAWFAPAVSFSGCLFFLLWGNYLNNIVVALIMGRFGFLALRGYLGEERDAPPRRLYRTGIVIFFAEYGMWFASCFWPGDTPANPYFWFDAVMTVTMALLIPAYEKAVSE